MRVPLCCARSDFLRRALSIRRRTAAAGDTADRLHSRATRGAQGRGEYLYFSPAGAAVAECLGELFGFAATRRNGDWADHSRRWGAGVCLARLAVVPRYWSG